MAINPGLPRDDPTYLEMQQIVRSDEGRKAAIEAAAQGIPALCGVDPLLRAKLGKRYQSIDQGTGCAGDFVAKMMHELGYRKGPQRRCPDGCIAQTGILWVAP